MAEKRGFSLSRLGAVVKHKTFFRDNALDFRHQPLKLSQPSIRVIKVLPELSSTGDIQCLIEHTTTETDYMCLSYVWGSTGPKTTTSRISINGKQFHVHANLLAFLTTARTKYPNENLWIDAICIAQTSDVERNHQVQQMGQIYSKAKSVIAWLGDRPFIAAFLQSLVTGHFWSEDNIVAGMNDFLADPYWTRAWITQEVLLASKLVFLSQNAEAPLELVAVFIKARDFGSSEFAYIRPLISSRGVKGNNLFSLLYIFREKQCSVNVDRVYSLLSICGEGSNLQVNYGLKRELLAMSILNHCPNGTCLCTMRLVFDLLDLWSLPTSMKRKSSTTQLSKIFGIPVFRYQGLKVSNCDRCRKQLPPLWGDEGEHVCLQFVCSSSRGHLYFPKGGGTVQYMEPEGDVPRNLKGHVKFTQSTDSRGFPIFRNPKIDDTVFRLEYEGFIEFCFEALLDLLLRETNKLGHVVQMCPWVWHNHASRRIHLTFGFDTDVERQLALDHAAPG